MHRRLYSGLPIICFEIIDMFIIIAHYLLETYGATCNVLDSLLSVTVSTSSLSTLQSWWWMIIYLKAADQGH